jgi:hypothetical protein
VVVLVVVVVVTVLIVVVAAAAPMLVMTNCPVAVLAHVCVGDGESNQMHFLVHEVMVAVAGTTCSLQSLWT